MKRTTLLGATIIVGLSYIVGVIHGKSQMELTHAGDHVQIGFSRNLSDGRISCSVDASIGGRPLDIPDIGAVMKYNHLDSELPLQMSNDYIARGILRWVSENTYGTTKRDGLDVPVEMINWNITALTHTPVEDSYGSGYSTRIRFEPLKKERSPINWQFSK